MSPPTQYRGLGYMGDGFYRSKDPTNSIKVLKVRIIVGLLLLSENRQLLIYILSDRLHKRLLNIDKLSDSNSKSTVVL